MLVQSTSTFRILIHAFLVVSTLTTASIKRARNASPLLRDESESGLVFDGDDTNRNPRARREHHKIKTPRPISFFEVDSSEDEVDSAGGASPPTGAVAEIDSSAAISVTHFHDEDRRIETELSKLNEKLAGLQRDRDRPGAAGAPGAAGGGPGVTTGLMPGMYYMPGGGAPGVPAFQGTVMQGPPFAGPFAAPAAPGGSFYPGGGIPISSAAGPVWQQSPQQAPVPWPQQVVQLGTAPGGAAPASPVWSSSPTSSISSGPPASARTTTVPMRAPANRYRRTKNLALIKRTSQKEHSYAVTK